MKKLYAYESFEVSVELEPVWKSSRGVKLSAPLGFIAVVQIKVAGAIFPMVRRYASQPLTGILSHDRSRGPHVRLQRWTADSRRHVFPV